MSRSNDFDPNATEISIDLIDARRFATAIREAIGCLEQSAGCYKLRKKSYYLEVKGYLEWKAGCLEAPENRMYAKSDPDATSGEPSCIDTSSRYIAVEEQKKVLATKKRLELIRRVENDIREQLRIIVCRHLENQNIQRETDVLRGKLEAFHSLAKITATVHTFLAGFLSWLEDGSPDGSRESDWYWNFYDMMIEEAIEKGLLIEGDE